MNTIQVKSGYIVLDASTATGGVRYMREVLKESAPYGRDGEGEEKEWKTKKLVDHKELVAACDSLVKRVDYILRKYASRTSFGWFADETQLVEIRREVDLIAAEAAGINRTCATAGCERRVHIAVVPARMDLGTPDAAKEVARTIVSQLGDLAAALRAGDVGRSFDNLLVRAKNLDALAVGFAGESIKMALETIKSERREIKGKIKRGQTPESAGKQADLSTVEGAIAMFVPMDESLADYAIDGPSATE
jgi:hypothetical protein